MSSALVEPRALATAELHHHQLFLTLAPPSSSNAGGISGLASPTTGGILLVIMPNYKGNLVTLRVGVRQSRGELRFFGSLRTERLQSPGFQAASLNPFFPTLW
jgi:hypothetical protein